MTTTHTHNDLPDAGRTPHHEIDAQLPTPAEKNALTNLALGILVWPEAGATLTVPATGTVALGAGTLTVATANDVTGAAHTHAIISSSNPGAAASLLATDASGLLRLAGLGIGAAGAANQIAMADGAKIGQAAGPLVEFDDTNNYLEIMGCNVGIGTPTPREKFTVDTGTILTYKSLAANDFTGLAIGRAGSWSNYQGKYANILFTNANSASNVMGAIGMTYDGYGRIDFHSFYSEGYGATGVLMSIRGTGNVGIATAAPTISDGVGLHIAGKILRLATAKTPASAGATGNAGEICWDASYVYVCIAANTWRRAAHATW